jgi:protein involved in polysaccharide export with SLBB domain
LLFGGCQAIDYYDTTLERPVPPQITPPRELEMCSLPAYRIEPPDVLQIELLKLVPLPPYRIESYDVLQINVLGTLLDQPINNYYLVEAEGTISLGPAYGTVRVIGMTIEESTEAIMRQLQLVLRQPEVSVQLSRASGLQPITGPYLVGPDGTINLRQYGSVYVSGKTIVEVTLALEKHLTQFLDSPEVSVDVASYNSKTYYIITEGSGQGDNVVRVPVTGNETVLDAISQIQGLSQLSSKNIWVARPAPGGFGCEQTLPVDWNAITRGGNTSTNYQVMPGDRIFIASDPVLALTDLVNRMIGPVERALGFSSLIASTSRSFQLIGYRRLSY